MKGLALTIKPFLCPWFCCDCKSFRQAQEKISKDGNILSFLSPKHEKSLKAKIDSDQTKLNDKNLAKQETEQRER